jgi:hypothetical protein
MSSSVGLYTSASISACRVGILEIAYRRLLEDWQPKKGAGADTGTRVFKAV